MFIFNNDDDDGQNRNEKPPIEDKAGQENLELGS